MYFTSTNNSFPYSSSLFLSEQDSEYKNDHVDISTMKSNDNSSNSDILSSNSYNVIVKKLQNVEENDFYSYLNENKVFRSEEIETNTPINNVLEEIEKKYLVMPNDAVDFDDRIMKEHFADEENNFFEIPDDMSRSCTSLYSPYSISSPSSLFSYSSSPSPLLISSPAPEFVDNLNENLEENNEKEQNFSLDIIHAVLSVLIESSAYKESKHVQQCRSALAHKLCEICYYNETAVYQIIKNVETVDVILKEFRKYIGTLNTNILLGEIELAFWNVIAHILIKIQHNPEEIEERFASAGLYCKDNVNQKDTYDNVGGIILFNNLLIECLADASQNYVNEMIYQSEFLHVMRKSNVLRSYCSNPQNEYNCFLSDSDDPNFPQTKKNCFKETKKRRREEIEEREERKKKNLKKDMFFDWCYF